MPTLYPCQYNRDFKHRIGCPHVEKVIKQNSKPMEFKECFECKPKPGSPQLCAQCLWVRENYKPMETNWEKSLVINLTDDGLSRETALQYVDFVNQLLAAQRDEIRKEVLKLNFSEYIIEDILNLPSLTN